MRVLASAASSRALTWLTAPSALHAVPLLVEYHHVPFAVSAETIAMPVTALLSTSLTLSSPPPPGKSTRLETIVPTAPAGGSAVLFSSAASVGVDDGSSTGAWLPFTRRNTKA